MSGPTEAERAALAAHPELRRLAELRDGGGWRFLHREDSGGVNLTTGFRTWSDGSADMLGVLGQTDARVWRTNPAGFMVWIREGGLAYVLDELSVLPAPHATNAPRLVIPRTPPPLWTS